MSTNNKPESPVFTDVSEIKAIKELEQELNEGVEAAATEEAAPAESAAPAAPAAPAAKERRKQTKRTAKKKPKGDGVQHAARSAGKKADKITVKEGKDSRDEALRDARVRSDARQRQQEINNKRIGDWVAVKAAYDRGIAVNGVVVAVTKRDAGNGNFIVMAVASVENTDFQALIPFSEFYRDDPINPDSTSRLSISQRQEQMLAKHLGAPVSYIITHTDSRTSEESGIVTYGIIASRRQALAMEDRRFFSGEHPRIYKGQYVNATIMSVSRQAMLLNVGGVDVRTDKRFVSNRYMPRMDSINPSTGRPFYSVGEKLEVIVADVLPRKDGYHDLVLSGAEAECRRIIENGPPLPVGVTTTAVLTRMFPRRSDRSKVVIFGYNEQFRLPIIVSKYSHDMIYRKPAPGDLLRVQILSYSPHGYAMCACRGIQDVSHF